MIISLIIAVKLYKYILSSFQSSYRIWIVIILFYIIGLVLSMFFIQLMYIFSSFGIEYTDIIKSINIIFTVFFAGIPKLFWFIPALTLSAIIYSIFQKFLMSAKTNNWLKLGVGFIIIVIPLTLWGILYPFFYISWETLISWAIANFIFNLLFTFSLFTLVEKIGSGNKKLNIKKNQ